MNLILLRPNDWISENEVLINDHRYVHIIKVLGLNVGNSVRVGLINDLRGTATLKVIQNEFLILNVLLSLLPPPRHPFDLILALPRPKMLRRILRVVAEFGVSNLHLINTARVEKSYWQSPLLHASTLEQALIEGLQRSGDTILPKIHLHHRFRPFVEDCLSDLCAGRQCWMAHPGVHTNFRPKVSKPAVVMVGPEGGFVPFEISLVQKNNVNFLNLGQRIFSVDTAVSTVLAQGISQFKY